MAQSATRSRLEFDSRNLVRSEAITYIMSEVPEEQGFEGCMTVKPQSLTQGPPS
jgi:hypothetical protein